MSEQYLFTSSRTQSASNNHGVGLTPMPKVAWVDVPKHIHWFFSMISKYPSGSEPELVAKQYIHASESWHPDNVGDLEGFKQALTFVNQHRLHTFTWFWKDGTKRWRMAKKPSVDVLTSWGKRGLAANIQDNRFWVHYSFDFDVFDKGFHAALPECRMAYLKKNDTKQLQSVQAFDNRITLAHKRLKAHMDAFDANILKGIEEAMKVTLGTSQMAKILTGNETGLAVALDGTHADAMQAFTDTLAEMVPEFVFDENKVAGKVAVNACKNNFVEVILLYDQLRHMRQQVTEAILGVSKDTSEDDEEEGELWYPSGTEASA